MLPLPPGGGRRTELRHRLVCFGCYLNESISCAIHYFVHPTLGSGGSRLKFAEPSNQDQSLADYRRMSNATTQAYRHLELQNQLWLNQRVGWIIQEFGHEHIRRVQCILPTSTRLAEYRGGTDEEVIEYFGKIARDIGLDPNKIDFSIQDHLETDDGGVALGLYGEPEDGRFSIDILARELSHPWRLVSTLVHELCHVHLLGHRRIDCEAHDHEPLTDLLCVFMGYGIICANTVIQDDVLGAGAHRQWYSGRRGYMSMAMYGYALALFAQLRNDDCKSWLRHMRADVRDAFNHSLRFFQSHGLPDLSCAPEVFVEPILKIDTTPEPPPTDALAPLYGHYIDPPVQEDDHDFPVEQSQRTDQSDSEAGTDENSTSDTAARCIYCGSTNNLWQLVSPTLGEIISCKECWDSIDQGQRQATERPHDEEAVSQLIGYVLFGSLAFLVVILVCSFVFSMWTN